ncbi:MAG: sigma 54-interacting transcriptional regulator [Planctomycetes bacterium]|nr:sigma 54-interacting transcriptional regulator [Planctomycetota bacterium]
MSRLWVLLALVCCSALAVAQREAARPELSALWVDPSKLAIDGDPAEWRASFDPTFEIARGDQLVDLGPRSADALWRGPDDASVRVWLGWNSVDFVLYGEVYDDVLQHDSERWYQGDSLELFLDTLDWTAEWGPDDWQVMLAPAWPERPWGVYPRPGQVQRPDGGFGGVEIVSAPFIGGYRFEARIPWRNFGRYSPSDGARLGFNFAQCDRDQRGFLESYGTWTGESAVAQESDRRGVLVLAPRGNEPQAGATRSDAPDSTSGRPYLLLALAALYGCALWTRKAWRSARVRRLGARIGVAIVVLVGITAVVTRLTKQSDARERRAQIEEHWRDFESWLASGALGWPEPQELLRSVEALLSGRSIPPPVRARFSPLLPSGALAGVELHTTRRGVPFVPIEIAGRARWSGASITPAQSLVFALPAPTAIDGVSLVVRVSDPRFPRMSPRRVPMLSVEVRREGRVVGPALELRDSEDLHFDEDPHVERPGMEPAFALPGGPRGSVHADALMLELGASVEADELVLRHVGPATSYTIQVVAVSARESAPNAAEVPGVRVTPEGEWQWAGAMADIEVETTAPGRSPKKSGTGQISRPIRVAEEVLGAVHLRDATPPSSTRWDVVPLAALVALAPFLVALFAEWIATRRRIRGKLAAGFAVTSAVPLLALTVLLEASLSAEHRERELERGNEELARAERELERDLRELERDAQRLLKIAELRKRVEGSFPETSEELTAWFGEGEGASRVLERTATDGRRVRVGSGPLWRAIPRSHVLGTGLARPFGQLLLCGVARSAPGADQPLSVAVLRAPSVPGVSARSSGAAPLRFLGAGRDQAPQLADLTPLLAGELRRGVYDAAGQELVGVLLVPPRERGVPVLGNFSLNELLLAAAITALFTVVLFAGILTGHLVGPIERLDRALRSGGAGDVEPEVSDEIGHLTAAIRTYSGQVVERVEELRRLQLAQGELSRRLDPDQAREAVLAFFARNASALSAWVLWRGEAGEELRAYGDGGREFVLPPEALTLQAAVVAGDVLHVVDRGGQAVLSEFERVLVGPARRVLSLPLIAAGETRGAIVLGFAGEELGSDFAFLQAAASQSAIVLENARLYRQAVRDNVTGFLTDPGFRQRVAEEIQRAQGEPESGVLLVQLRLTGLPRDDELAGERLREAAQRLRLAVRGLAFFGRAGAGDLKIALPWTKGAPNFEALARRLVDRVSTGPWPDGEPVTGLFAAHAAWPADGPSARFVLAVLEERLTEEQSGVPTLQLVKLSSLVPVDFVASSPIMIQLLDTVQRIAEQEITVLIGGETGVGKDRLAELVHRWSRRANGPLVHVHCPSLSASLIEDELFGHAKGAFTGAHTRRVGPFEYASGGTVVLDEVAGLPPAGQVALLRLLETREVLPLGSERPLPIDVRIVATSSKDLAVEVERGNFRGDLYFRLNVAQVTVPPLRLRRQALPDLVEAFVRRFNASADRPVTAVHPRVMDALFEHAWPGNLRELENVLSKACVLASGGELGAEHLELSSAAAEDGAVSVESELPNRTSSRQERLLESLAPGQRITSAEYAEREQISGRTALRDLLDLVELGFLVREGTRRGTRFRRAAKVAPASSGH